MNKINKNEFLELSIEDKINYLNSKLNSGSTVTRIRTDLEISEHSLQIIIKNGGYRYERKLNNYVLKDIEKGKYNLDINKLLNQIESINDKVDKIYEHCILQNSTVSNEVKNCENKVAKIEDKLYTALCEFLDKHK